MATWWFGLIIGFVNGFIGLIQPNAKIMRKSVFGATILTIGVTAVFGFLGFLVGKFIIAHLDIN